MELRVADRAVEVKALGEHLAQARVQFEHFQEAIAAQRLEDRRAFDRIAGRLENDLAGAQQRLLTQQATLGQQDTQLAQLRTDHDARAGELRAARKEFTAAQADLEQMTRQLAGVALRAEAAKLDKVNGELIEAGMALAAQRGQTELLEDRLAGMAAELDKLALA